MSLSPDAGGLASVETEAYMGVIGKFIPKFRK
jgi:hypothetical protein